MLKRWLQEIMNIEGIEGVFIASGRVKIIEKLGLSLKESQLEALALRIQRIVAGFNLKVQKINEIEFYWQNLYVISRVSNNFLLVTISRTSNVLSLLRITLNVALANLLEDKKFRKIIDDQVSDKSYALEKGEIEEAEKKIISKLK